MTSFRHELPDIDQLRKEYFIVDMHFHTKYSHDCATPVESITKRARALDLRIAITDHNRVQGMLAAKKIVPEHIMPGIEICTKDGKEVIPYFYHADELVEFFNAQVAPHIKAKTSLQSNRTSLSTTALLEELGRCNCVVALPHPFAMVPRRSFSFFDNERRKPLLRHVHAVEAMNATMMHRHNLAAAGWAIKHDKAIIGGSDGHKLTNMGQVVTCAKASTWEEFLDQIKMKRTTVVGTEHNVGYKMVLTTELLRQKARIIKNFRMQKKL